MSGEGGWGDGGPMGQPGDGGGTSPSGLIRLVRLNLGQGENIPIPQGEVQCPSSLC